MEPSSTQEKADSEEFRVTLEALPDDAVFCILRWLGPKDLCNVAIVSKRLRLLACDDCLWRRFAAEYALLENVSKHKKGR